MKWKNKMDLKLKNKRAIITGGSRGIGKSMLEVFGKNPEIYTKNTYKHPLYIPCRGSL